MEAKAATIEAEAALVERLRDGDPAALALLMDRYASRVYRLAYGITRNEADAEEVVQDVFLTLAPKIHSFEGLRGVEGLSNEKAAEALGESVASVKSRLHRARMALREQVSESLGPAG